MHVVLAVSLNHLCGLIFARLLFAFLSISLSPVPLLFLLSTLCLRVFACRCSCRLVALFGLLFHFPLSSRLAVCVLPPSATDLLPHSRENMLTLTANASPFFPPLFPLLLSLSLASLGSCSPATPFYSHLYLLPLPPVNPNPDSCLHLRRNGCHFLFVAFSLSSSRTPNSRFPSLSFPSLSPSRSRIHLLVSASAVAAAFPPLTHTLTFAVSLSLSLPTIPSQLANVSSCVPAVAGKS